MNDFQRYLAEEFVEDYQEGRMTRREALKLIASVLGNLVLAQTFLASCAPPPAQPTTAATSPPVPSTSAPVATESAATPTTASSPTDSSATATAQPAPASPTPVLSGTVSPDDPAVEAGSVEFTSEADGATITGYLARPNLEGAFPVILVCHENRGLTDHIRDVARRVAKAGYVGLAVDLLSRQGGSETVGSSQVPGVLGNTQPDQFVQDFLSGWHYLQTQPFAQAERVGMTGFCFGGGVTWRVATGMPELKAAVPFYGPHPSVADVPNINAAVLAIYGELDTRINQGIPAIEAAMQQNNKVYEKLIYPNADHAFHNDTGSRYQPEAAQDAWAQTLAWFGQYL